MIKELSNKKLFLIVLWMVFAIIPGINAAQPSAQSSINKMVDAIKQHPSLDIVFTVWSNSSSISGSMSVAGKCFYLSTPEMKIWYDGKTQWSYAPSAGEVNVTTPTAEELAQSNPISILSNLNNSFTFRRLKAIAGQEKIELMPKKQSYDFASAVLTIDSMTSLPKELLIKDSKSKTTTITISTIKGGKTKPAGAFRFNSASYPGVEVVDLR